eukprot:7947096-Pyramimonas_sp.AAC.1
MEGHRSGRACPSRLLCLCGRRWQRRQHAAPPRLWARAAIPGSLPTLRAGGDDWVSGGLEPQRVSPVGLRPILSRLRGPGMGGRVAAG